MLYWTRFQWSFLQELESSVWPLVLSQTSLRPMRTPPATSPDEDETPAERYSKYEERIQSYRSELNDPCTSVAEECHCGLALPRCCQTEIHGRYLAHVGTRMSLSCNRRKAGLAKGKTLPTESRVESLDNAARLRNLSIQCGDGDHRRHLNTLQRPYR